jgi:hypothetical protein
MTVTQPLWLREEDVPVLPDGWIALTTNEACEQLKPGKLYSGKTTFESGDIPVLSQGESGFVGYHNDAPGVVASRNNPVVTFANHTCAMRLMTHPYSCIQNIFSKVGKDGVCDTRYFYYAAMGRVTIGDYKGHHPLFRQAYIPIPPLDTQHQIASILSAYDDLIENNTRRIEILEEMARRLYEEWFVHFRFPGHEEVSFKESELGRIPEGWEVKLLGEVAELSWGDTKTTKKSYTDAGYVAYSAAGPDGFLPYFDHDRPGIVLSAIGANCGLTWLALEKWSCIKNTIKFWPVDDQVSCEYLYLATHGKEYWPKRGAAQPFISQGDARGCKIIVPPSSLHDRFQDVAKGAFRLASVLYKKNTNLRAQRDLLLPKLVSGEIDVSDIPMPDDKEVEAA